MNTGFDDNAPSAFTAGLDFSIREMKRYDDFQGFLKIREEMSRFLLNLHRSNIAESGVQQTHFLFVALLHLDNMEREIRISEENEEIARAEMVHEEIRSLKSLILCYIRRIRLF